MKLGDLISLNYGKGLPKRDRIIGKNPVYGSGGIIDYHNDYYVKGPGIIVGRKGTIGSIYYEKLDFHPIDTVYYIEEDQERYDIKFLYYYLKTLNLDKLNNDAAVPGLNRNAAYMQEIIIPKSIQTQQKIANILSKYDDLIENNTKRIKILEEMAQSIYKEWFVNFRFPGWEDTVFVDSGTDFGEIPEGWEVKKVRDTFKVVLGGTPARKKEEFWGGTIPWINSGKVNEYMIINESEFITELGYKNSSTKLMIKDSTVIAITGATLGQISVLGIEACANQSVVGIYDTKLLYNYYIFGFFTNNIKSIIGAAGGGAQQHINKEIVNQTLILIPEENIIETYNEIMGNILKDIEKLFKLNQNLKRTRNELIPKLVTGQIDVDDLDVK